MDHTEGGDQRFDFRAGWVAMPLAIGAFPEELPDIVGADVLQFGDGFLDVFTGTIESRAHDEKLDGLAGESLAFADLVAQRQGRSAARPKMCFESDRVFGDFVFCEWHGGKWVVLQRRMRFKGGKDSGGTRKVMLRACPGTRWMKPRLSSVSTIECTLGGVIWKYRCMSASAGAQPFTRLY